MRNVSQTKKMQQGRGVRRGQQKHNYNDSRAELDNFHGKFCSKGGFEGESAETKPLKVDGNLAR